MPAAEQVCSRHSDFRKEGTKGMKDIETIRVKAQNIGVFLPLLPDTAPLSVPETVHGREMPGRAVLVMQPGNDARAFET